MPAFIENVGQIVKRVEVFTLHCTLSCDILGLQLFIRIILLTAHGYEAVTEPGIERL